RSNILNKRPPFIMPLTLELPNLRSSLVFLAHKFFLITTIAIRMSYLGIVQVPHSTIRLSHNVIERHGFGVDACTTNLTALCCLQRILNKRGRFRFASEVFAAPAFCFRNEVELGIVCYCLEYCGIVVAFANRL